MTTGVRPSSVPWWVHPFRVEAQVRETWSARFGSEQGAALGRLQRNVAVSTLLLLVGCVLALAVAVGVSVVTGSPETGLTATGYAFLASLVIVVLQRLAIFQRNACLDTLAKAMGERDPALSVYAARQLLRSPAAFDRWSQSHPEHR